ncbi:hypothetical protein [Methylobacterium sp. WL120]|uniref:hypothetical protein n=1 Tax=Methylobacterium sp. WL120 TaxID=2603887 RepID=UPI0011CC44D7|nr:hypothetical protein [Methylobacterium sp. WL120]TXM69625.1 hypothetical protein FV229_04590 [Methylobacterium sp. WL120]
MARPTEQEVGKAGLKLQAAQIFLDSRLGDFQASLLVGAPAELEMARQGAIGALEALLDARLYHHTLMMRLTGMEGEDA